MDIKKIVLITVVSCMASVCTMAQDDMYFIPKKVNKHVTTVQKQQSVNVTYRDIDEYNRRGHFASRYQNVDLDTLYSDVIVFDTTTVDTITNEVLNEDLEYAYEPEDDYVYSRRLSRFDDFYWYAPLYYGWYGYAPYWYGRPYWYAGLYYDSWYDPWFYDWYRPWGWHYSWYWPVSHYHRYYGVTGTTNHSRSYRRGNGVNNNFRRFRGTGNRVNNSQNVYNRNSGRANNNRFRGNRQNNYNRQNNFNRYNTQSRPSYNNSFRDTRGGGNFRSGGSFGGNRGGGGIRSRR